MDSSKTYAHVWNIYVVSICLWGNSFAYQCYEGLFCHCIFLPFFSLASSSPSSLSTSSTSLFDEISSVQSEGIPISPYIVRKAIENTCIPIGDLPEDKLSSGQGLMQVDK